MKKLLCAVSLAGLLTAGVGFAGPQISGDAHVDTDHVIAWHWNGVKWPQKINECVSKFGGLRHHADVHYDIDPKTLMESAAAKVDGKTIDLYPMGMGGEYEFMSDFSHDSEDGQIDRVIFHEPIVKGLDKEAISVAYDIVVDGDKEDLKYQNVVCEFQSPGFR